MAFKVHKTDDGRVMPCEAMLAQGLTPKLGMALKLESGKLVTASGANRPEYISMAERKEPCGEGEAIPVLRAAADVIWETEAASAMTGKKIGDRADVSGDGMGVVPSADGPAVIVSLDGTAAGSRVTVRFDGICGSCGGSDGGGAEDDGSQDPTE